MSLQMRPGGRALRGGPRGGRRRLRLQLRMRLLRDLRGEDGARLSELRRRAGAIAEEAAGNLAWLETKQPS